MSSPSWGETADVTGGRSGSRLRASVPLTFSIHGFTLEWDRAIGFCGPSKAMIGRRPLD